jgi:hypothetical protein
MKYNYSNNKPQPTKYIYRGYVMVTTFGLDPGKNEAFEDDIDFDLPNLIESREAGIKWYVDTLKGIAREGKYFLPFARHPDFILGKHAAYMVSLSLIEIIDSEDRMYILLSTDENYMDITLEMEEMLFGKVEFQKLIKQLIDYDLIPKYEK